MLVLAILAALTPLTDWEKMQKYPSLKTSFFEIYEACEQRPYIMLVAENWLFVNPVITTIDGRTRTRGREFMPAQVGDINCDGITNFIDYCIALEYYERDQEDVLELLFFKTEEETSRSKFVLYEV